MSTERAKKPPYRKCVGALLFNGEGRVLVARRRDIAEEAWQLPQGGIDDGETPEQAIIRELAEEIGTNKAEIIAESRDWLAYDLPDDLVGRKWEGRYCGQKQKWFALRFTGRDEDIDVNLGAEPEFSDWKWVPVETLTEMIVPFKRRVYEAVVAEFSYLAGDPNHR